MTQRRGKNIWSGVLVGFMFLLFILTIFFGVLTGKKIEEDVEKSLPIVKISLLNTTLNEVHENGKNVKYGGNNLEIFDNGITFFYDNVEFKGRGNFSWDADKKSYRIKFDEKVDLFGMGKKKKWALIANSVDDSLMRNDLAYFLSDLTGGEYKMEGEFVELIINDEKLGVYYLVKTVEIDDQAMDLEEPDGVLVEMDNAYCRSEEQYWTAKNGDCFTVKDIVTEDLTDETMKGFLKEYNELLAAISKQDFKKVSKIIDAESFARYFLISELTANPDAYMTSWYFYKDGANDKIHTGPVWDFDAAFGNSNWGDWPEGFYAPETTMARFEYVYEKKAGFCGYDRKKAFRETAELSWVMCDLLEIPEFREMAGKIYLRDFQGKKDSVLEHIAAVAEEIAVAAQGDIEKWGKGDFDTAVEYLTWWVTERFKLFDGKLIEKLLNIEVI